MSYHPLFIFIFDDSLIIEKKNRSYNLKIKWTDKVA